MWSAEVWGHQWLDLPPLYLSWMQMDEARTWLHCSCWRIDNILIPTHTTCIKIQTWLHIYAQKGKLEHSIWLYTSTLCLTVHSSNLALCCSHIKLKKAKLIHHPPLPASLSFSLLLCVAIPVYSKHRRPKEYNQYVPDAWWDGTNFYCRARCACRAFTVCQRHTGDF